MSRFAIEPCTVADYAELLAVIEGERAVRTFNLEDVERLLAFNGAYAARVDGVLAAAAGIAVQWSGLGSAWALVAPLGRAHPVFVHRAIRRGLREIAAREKLRRVEARVMEAFYPGCLGVERLGFIYEARLALCGPAGETMWQYVYYPGGVPQ